MQGLRQRVTLGGFEGRECSTVALELHVCADAEKGFYTQDECEYRDFGAVFEGGGEGDAEAVSARFFAVRAMCVSIHTSYVSQLGACSCN
jgi:hypothetical protein